MSISSRQIGWGTEENLLWQISKQLERLTQVTAITGPITTLTTIGTSGPSTLVGVTLNIPNYADGGVLSLTAIGSTPNANAGTITGTVLNFEPASATFGGVVTTGTQTFEGSKTFNKDLIINSVNVGKGGGSVLGNVAFGIDALNSNTTGPWNTAIGYNALKLNTTKGWNTAVGLFTLANYIDVDPISVASNNTAIGVSALRFLTTSRWNTAVGGNAYLNLTTGGFNIGIGVGAGRGITTGSYNTIIGNYQTAPFGATLSNTVVIGDGQASTRFYSPASGNVLFGTTTDAGYKLDVNGTGNFSGALSGTSATFSGNVVLGTTALSGGGAAQWLTANGTAYGGGLISSVSGVIKAYYYYDNGANAAVVQGGAGVGVQLLANNVAALTIASTGAATFSSSVTLGNFTTTEINALTPVAGMVVFNTTLSVVCFYDGTAWKKVSHSAM